jgi:hypothetical protein
MASPNSISSSAVVVCAIDSLACDLQGEAMLLNMQSGTYFGLNRLGARIWNLIQKPVKVSDINNELLKQFKVEASQCESDLLAFLKHLKDQGLIEVR